MKEVSAREPLGKRNVGEDSLWSVPCVAAGPPGSMDGSGCSFAHELTLLSIFPSGL